MSTVSYFVRYRGLPRPREAFERYYRERHARILGEFPAIRGLVLHAPLDWRDPHPVDPDGTDFLAEMRFDDAAALAMALASEARERARVDFANLPKGGAQVTHQAMRSLRLL
jgi:uncharacterized protein (TIGR02118 family)